VLNLTAATSAAVAGTHTVEVGIWRRRRADMTQIANANIRCPDR